MKRRLFAATAVTSVAFGYCPHAGAQTYDWTGFYVGGVVGYGTLGPNTATIRTLGPGNLGSQVPAFATGAPLAIPSIGPLGSSAFTGGGTLGYNRQHGHLVVGAETDFSSLSTRASGSFTSPLPNGSAATGVTVGTDWLYTLRGRLGYAQDRWLVFGTGGLALGSTHLASNFGINERGMNASYTPLGLPFPTPGKGTFVSSRYGAQGQGFASREDVRVGYTLGGGIEYAVSNHLTLKLEGLYYDLGADTLLVTSHGQFRTSTTTTTVPFLGPTTTTNASASGRFTAQPYLTRYRFDGAIVRVGANYKF